MNCRICNSDRIKTVFSFDIASLLKCRNCGIMFWDKIPTKEQIQHLYSNKDYMEYHSAYFKDSYEGYDENSQHIKNYSEILNTMTTKYNTRGYLLDVGCATGVFLDLARKKGWKTKGIEISPDFADYGRKHFNLDIFCGELAEAQLRDKTFDCITGWDILEHIADPVAFLKEIRRLLKDDGIIFIWTINAKSILNYLGHFLYRISFGKISAPVKKLYGFEDFSFHHLYFFSPQSLQYLLEKCGFEVLEFKQQEYPVERIGVNPIMAFFLHIIYFFQNIFNLKTEVTVLAKKKL